MIALRSNGVERFKENYNLLSKATFVCGFLTGYSAKQTINDIGQSKSYQKRSFIKIQRLQNLVLVTPLDAYIERDGNDFIAKTIDLPLYGYGEDVIDAVDMLKREVESLYYELQEDDNFSEEWLQIKNILKKHIVNE